MTGNRGSTQGERTVRIPASVDMVMSIKRDVIVVKDKNYFLVILSSIGISFLTSLFSMSIE